MKFKKQHVLSSLLWLLPALATAQTIYECPGTGGPVFTNTPCAGGKQLDLPPPNVIDTATSPQPQAADIVAQAYSAFSILSPEEAGTVHTNTGRFQVALTLTPGLQDGNGISVSLDGTQLPTLRYSLHFDITQEEWESAATANVQHVLQAAVLDRSGNLLIAATQVQFYVRRAVIRKD